MTVPKLNELAACKLIETAKIDRELNVYLPDLKPGRSINRQYLFNVSAHNSCRIQALTTNIDYQHGEARLLSREHQGVDEKEERAGS